MSTTYSGNPANVSNTLTRTITGCANNGSGFVRVTTSVAHLFSSFDVVTITGVVGTTEANGTHKITVIDATHFDLPTVAFTHAYVSGGSVTDNSLTPAAALPSDGEQLTASSIVATFQLLLDRTQFLATKDVANAALITVRPLPFNISYGTDWRVGDDGSGSATGSLLTAAATTGTPLIFDISDYLVGMDGRSIAQMQATFAVGQAHASPPATLPEMRLYRTQSLTTTGVAPAADQSLYSGISSFFPNSGGTGASYYNSGHLQTWTIVADQNNVIDTTRRYYLILFDEKGANSHPLNIYYGFQLAIY